MSVVFPSDTDVVAKVHFESEDQRAEANFPLPTKLPATDVALALKAPLDALGGFVIRPDHRIPGRFFIFGPEIQEGDGWSEDDFNMAAQEAEIAVKHAVIFAVERVRAAEAALKNALASVDGLPLKDAA